MPGSTRRNRRVQDVMTKKSGAGQAPLFLYYRWAFTKAILSAPIGYLD
jgi:hypothetical protein